MTTQSIVSTYYIQNNLTNKINAINLIIVPGHAIWKGQNISDWKNENDWILEKHQRNSNGQFILTLNKHIQKGIHLLSLNLSNSILIFSGTQSRFKAGPRSEANTYYSIAEAQKFFNMFKNDDFKSKIYLEEYARDSYENLLFSICRFHEITGGYPKDISVVGFKFKRKRFIHYHRKAIQFPLNRFHYFGIDMPILNISNIPNDYNTLKRTMNDPYLCHANQYIRQIRNPQLRFPPYIITCPEIKSLLMYCGQEWFSDFLPWFNKAI